MDGDLVSGLRARIEEAHSAFRARVDALLAQPNGDETAAGGWTLKEMLGHIAFWEEASVPVMTYVLQMRPIPDRWAFGSGFLADGDWPTTEVHNAREAAWAAAQPLESVLARWDASYVLSLEAMTQLADVDIESNVAYFDQLVDHYYEHLAELG